MNQSNPKTSAPFLVPLFAAALLLTVGSVGCSPETVQSASRDAQKNAAVVQREAQRAERKARPQFQKANLGGRVLAALLANQNLPHTIRVDASETGVKLRGSVKTSEQKKLAERIARDTLQSGKTVQNDLVVETNSGNN